MAALALPIVLGLEAGTAAFVAAAMVGSYLDAAFVFPTLFPPDATYGPQIDGQPIGRWSEGTAIPRVFGASGRVPGQVIWQSPIQEIKDEQSGGGKGGAASDYIVYKYYAHVAVSFCAGPVARVKKILADGKTVWNIAPDIDYTSTQIDGAVSIEYTSWGAGTGGHAAHYILTLIASGSGSPDLSLLKSGKKLLITAPGLGGGPHEVDVMSSSADIVAATTTCKLKVGITVGVGPGGGVHPWAGWASGTTILHQDLPTHSGKHFHQVRFHSGSASQQPDSMLETYKGIGEVPAFRGNCYCMFENLGLTDWGNRIPSFTAIIEEDDSRLMTEAMQSILEEGDLDPGEYDLSAVEDKVLEGYVIAGPQETMKSLQPLLIQNDLLVQQDASTLRFFHRKDARRVDIAAKHLAASAGKRSRSPITVTEVPISSLSDEVNLSYLDLNNQYNKGSQRQRRNNDVSSKEQGINLPIVMDSVEARAIASRLLWSEWNQRLRVRFEVPALEYIDKLREGDVARLNALGEDWEVLIHKIDRGANLMMRCEGTVEDKNMLAGYPVGEDVNLLMSGGGEDGGYAGANPSMFSPAVNFVPFECRPLKEAHLRTPGFYFAVCSADSRFNFNGAVLFESIDGENYERITTVTGAAHMGYMTAYTGKTAYHGQWDRVNEITVEFLSGTPQSVTEIEVLNGSNRAIFGREVIAFETATHVSGTTYKLTKLLRGLRGTEAFIGEMDSAVTARMPFVMLNQPFVHFHEVPAAAIGQTRHYKMVPFGSTPEEQLAQTIFVQALNVKPMPPMSLAKTLDGANNATITWVPRYRSMVSIIGPGGRPSGEPKEEFRTEILDGGATVQRTKTATEEAKTIYTAAEATADGLTPGASLKVRISQFSEYHRFGDATPVQSV
jgi:hypothetical protein